MGVAAFFYIITRNRYYDCTCYPDALYPGNIEDVVNAVSAVSAESAESTVNAESAESTVSAESTESAVSIVHRRQYTH